MPSAIDLKAEIAILGGRCSLHRRHKVGAPVAVTRTDDLAPFALFTDFARCQRCDAPMFRVRRMGPGSDGATKWAPVS